MAQGYPLGPEAKRRASRPVDRGAIVVTMGIGCSGASGFKMSGGQNDHMTAVEKEPLPISVDAAPLARAQIMHQWWKDVAFLHWRVDPDAVAPLLPVGTQPDTFDGSSWVGLIPFRMVGAGIARGPAVPWLGSFAETNVRLYSVDASGRRGVVFRSLETSRLAVVFGARLTFGVPYCWARMRVRHVDRGIEYTTTRRWPGRRGIGARVVITPQADVVTSDPLAAFLTARWGLHSRWVGRTLYTPNQHGPWPLHRATVQHLDDELVAAAGLPGVTAREPDSVLWSPGVRTVFGLPIDARRPLGK
jgi:uncharacterized protein